ncbi:MAG: GNAT family N-acetyltransferase [Candidatus Dormibacteraeota bacterium]|nr:GNAT family N-acetyltransferase [Candidatus Dormibacteraeota bacterium]
MVGELLVTARFEGVVMAETATAIHDIGAVRKAKAGEVHRLAAVLARAFYDDPPTRWVFPADSRRVSQLDRSFALYLRKLWFAQDECYTTDGIAGAAIWESPGKWQTSVFQQLRLAPALLAINGRFFPRLLQTITVLESNHPKELHYYLPFVGVDPELQGRGIGSALLRPILDRCDREGVPAYLEASTPGNRALYERHGFVVTEEFVLGKGSPPLWRMWRKPAS